MWVYKRGLLVLHLQAHAGNIESARTTDAAPVASSYCHGQFLSMEWQPRICTLLERSRTLAEFLSMLEDRNYHVDTRPPSIRTRGWVR
jgi:hypothetical protein